MLPIQLKIVDILVDEPKLETDEGILEGPSTYHMVVEITDNEHVAVEINAESYSQLYNIVKGVL